MDNRKLFTVMIAVGGSGGHLYPAQALALDLLKEKPNISIVFVGHGLKTNPFFDAKLFTYEEVKSSTLCLKKWWSIPIQLISLCRGYRKSLSILKKAQPDVMIGFGSYHSFPPLLAAQVKKIPYILFESNAVLGKVNAFFSKKAHTNAYQLFSLKEKSRKNFYKVALPLIEEKLQRIPVEQAREFFDLDPDVDTILIFGGSQGAYSLNLLAVEALKILKQKQKIFQVIHLVGLNTSLESIQEGYNLCGIRACVKAFEPSMQYAYCAADVAITRAGSNTIAELLHHQLLSLLIPYPYLADKHQYLNASYVCEHLNLGAWLEQKGLTPEILAASLETLVQRKMQQKMIKGSDQEKISSLSDLVLQVLAKEKI